jgi:hypothetical protein
VLELEEMLAIGSEVAIADIDAFSPVPPNSPPHRPASEVVVIGTSDIPKPPAARKEKSSSSNGKKGKVANSSKDLFDVAGSSKSKDYAPVDVEKKKKKKKAEKPKKKNEKRTPEMVREIFLE